MEFRIVFWLFPKLLIVYLIYSYTYVTSRLDLETSMLGLITKLEGEGGNSYLIETNLRSYRLGNIFVSIQKLDQTWVC